MSLRTLCYSAAFAVAAMAVPALAQSDSRYAGMDKDEAGLWYMMDKAEAQIKTSGARIKDPALETYVRDLTCKVVGPDCEKLRIYVLNAPEFNAAMAPNGMMMVNSGLLLRAENEAQLGCVIGHEFGHFEQGHSLKLWRSVKNASNLNLFIPIAGGLIGLSNVYSFSQDQETESDKIGFELVSKQGYAPSECADVWTNLIEEDSESVLKKKRKRSKKTKTGMFSSHPVPQKRVETLTALAAETSGGQVTGAEIYQAKTGAFLGQWLRSELIAKDYDRHIHLFETLKERGRSAGVMDYYLGEAHRQRRGEGDRDKAMEYWTSAATHADAPAQTWRAMAEYNRRKGHNAKALQDYRTYLAKAPNAPDKALVGKYIERLSQEN